MSIKRCKGREWFKYKPDDIKHVFLECKKLYGFNKEEVVKVDDKVNENIDRHIKENNIKKYYCNVCKYETLDSANYSHHKKRTR